MNRKSLSIIAAIGLSLSSASQITAGNSASVIAIGTLATAAGVSHYRGAQIQQEQPQQLIDRQQRENEKHLSMLTLASFSIKKKSITSKDYSLTVTQEWSRPANLSFHVYYETAERKPWGMYTGDLTVLESIIDQSELGKSTEDFLSRVDTEQNRMLDAAMAIVEERIRDGKDPVTGK